MIYIYVFFTTNKLNKPGMERDGHIVFFIPVNRRVAFMMTGDDDRRPIHHIPSIVGPVLIMAPCFPSESLNVKISPFSRSKSWWIWWNMFPYIHHAGPNFKSYPMIFPSYFWRREGINKFNIHH